MILLIKRGLNGYDKYAIEKNIRNMMCDYTKDKKWNLVDQVKCLTLEHSMAAKRGNFSDFFLPLRGVRQLKDTLLNGKSNEILFITKQVLPLTRAIKENDDFMIANVIKKYSPLLSSDNQKFNENPISQISQARESIDKLKKQLNQKGDSSLIKVLTFIHKSQLLTLPDKFIPHLQEDSVEENEESEFDKKLESEESRAWNRSLKTTLKQVETYAKYIADELSFGTHQGVKGLQFSRVMVVLDDEDAGGFLFSYEKLFGAKGLTANDIKNEAEGKDSTQARTRRLFYVTCSRAEKSLAIVAYTKAPDAIKRHAIESKWFNENEIIVV